MGINVLLEGENSEPIEWVKESLPKSLALHKLPFYESPQFPLSGSIDPYGDTIFNRLQASTLLVEWAELSRLVEESERKVMDDVSRLLVACRNGVHLYVRFIGD